MMPNYLKIGIPSSTKHNYYITFKNIPSNFQNDIRMSSIIVLDYVYLYYHTFRPHIFVYKTKIRVESSQI